MAATILIVGDRDYLCQMLHEWLSLIYSKCRITETSNRTEAIDSQSVLKAVEHVKAALPQTPVVVLTSDVNKADHTLVTANRAEAYLDKNQVITKLPPLLKALLSSQIQPDGPKRNKAMSY